MTIIFSIILYNRVKIIMTAKNISLVSHDVAQSKIPRKFIDQMSLTKNDTISFYDETYFKPKS